MIDPLALEALNGELAKHGLGIPVRIMKRALEDAGVMLTLRDPAGRAASAHLQQHAELGRQQKALPDNPWSALIPEI